MKLPKWTLKKKKEENKNLSEEEALLEELLKKIPKRKRKLALHLYRLYKKGHHLRANKNFDHNQMLEELKKHE